jgi:hypothetical protein
MNTTPIYRVTIQRGDSNDQLVGYFLQQPDAKAIHGVLNPADRVRFALSALEDYPTFKDITEPGYAITYPVKGTDGALY